MEVSSLSLDFVIFKEPPLTWKIIPLTFKFFLVMNESTWKNALRDENSRICRVAEHVHGLPKI